MRKRFINQQKIIMRCVRKMNNKISIRQTVGTRSYFSDKKFLTIERGGVGGIATWHCYLPPFR